MRGLVVLVLAASSAARAEPPPTGVLIGRVFERGSSVPLPGATITPAAGAPVSTDAEGRFRLILPAGANELLLTEATHEPLRTTETIRAGQGIVVEYRLLPLPPFRRRYETTVEGEARHEGERFTLRGEELHQVPGTLGDPFRAITLLPGVATPVPLLPLYAVRGASPGMNGYLLDGMAVPQLFHLLVGGGTVHPQLVERLDFYPGSYDASLGGYAGAMIDAETRPARSDGAHGEVELKLYDLSAMAEAKLPRDVRVTIAGHYGYPGPIVGLLAPGVDLQYWDYQLRIDWRGLTVEALGSFDAVSLPSDFFGMATLKAVAEEFRLTFHRVQVRERARVRGWSLEVALVGGYDQLRVFGGYGVEKLSLSARATVQRRWRRITLFAGLSGEVSRFQGTNFNAATGPQAPDELDELADPRVGLVGGLFAQATAEVIARRLFVTGGARVDVYHAGTRTLIGIDPRVTVRAPLSHFLALKAGFGLYQQPPSFPVPLPGIDTFALQLGLQRAIQGSAGLEVTLPQSLELHLTGFYQEFRNINDLVVDFGLDLCSSTPPDSLSGLPGRITRQLDGRAFGMELLLRRHAGRLTGWIAYTLSRSERIYSCGLRPADFDQTHVLNAVAQVRLPWHLLLGARLLVSSGRPYSLANDELVTTLRNNARLDPYFQIDLRIDREWIFKRWILSAFLEVLNLSYSQTTFAVYYQADVAGVVTPRALGLRWVLPTIGLRGRL